MTNDKSYLLMLSATWLLVAGCTSEGPVPTAEPAGVPVAEQAAEPVEPEPVRPDPAEVWAGLVTEARGHLEAEQLEQAQVAIGQLDQVYASPERPDAEQRGQLAELQQQATGLERRQSARLREELLAEAEGLMDQGDYESAAVALNRVLALSPTAGQQQTANSALQEIERRRAAGRELRSLLRLLGSELAADVKSAQSRLLADPPTAVPLLLETLQQADEPRRVANAMPVLRRMGRPDVTLPALVAVLGRTEQQELWEQVVREIVLAGQPGAGPELLELAVSSPLDPQRMAALTALAQVPDPPQPTAVALLPLAFQDGPALDKTLEVMAHAVQVHGQHDWLVRRAMEFELTSQQQQLLEGLPGRLDELLQQQAASDVPSPLGEAVRVLAASIRHLPPQPLEEVTVYRVSGESPDGPAQGVLDGVWNSVERETMWRQPLGASPPSIILDLGAARVVTGVRIWNWNEPQGTQRGWKEVDVFVSDDPRALRPDAAGILPPAPGLDDPPDYSSLLPVPFVRGRYVKLQARSLWNEDAHTGLAEVQVLGF